ncbi:NYN domain-containing protein [Treponema parvum]|uniref:NYN domain-containing protein n=1 Tax=Treponema parvum TaxID=138851 RepID=A0A975IE18_9SPIR|nr:NYN domain-containing protein [Treponema parvum]QTQ13408.1 NYN domain-containing protein [Treponema parvum]
MIDIEGQKKIAVLIDADNTPYNKLAAILQEIAVHGHIITKRAYGDFSSAHLKHWKDVLNENAILPIQQFSYTKGKNSSDSAMIIDAMDLLYTEKYDAFVLVSSDSDFTKLASRLRESQEFVFGVGQKKTPVSFIKACDDFIYIENLTEEPETATETPVSRQEENLQKRASQAETAKQDAKNRTNRMSDRQFRQIYRLLSNAYEKYADDNGWANVSAAGSLFKRMDPGFDTRDFGFRKLSDLIEYLKDDFEITKVAGANNRGMTILYRPKTV